MAKVEVLIPALLSQMTGGIRNYNVQGETIKDALKAVAEKSPGLAVHLFDEAGALRRLLLCAHNGVIVDCRNLSDITLCEQDRIVLLASIAGG